MPNHNENLEQLENQYNKVYKKYGDANIDGFNLFESFWKAFGDKDNLISGKKVFWRGNEKAPRQFKQIKGIFDEVGVPKQIGFVPNKLFLAP